MVGPCELPAYGFSIPHVILYKQTCRYSRMCAFVVWNFALEVKHQDRCFLGVNTKVGLQVVVITEVTVQATLLHIKKKQN